MELYYVLYSKKGSDSNNKDILKVYLRAQLLQSCPTLFEPVDCCPPGSSVHGILQARIPEWVGMPSSRVSSLTRDWTQVSCVFYIEGGFFTHWVTWEALKVYTALDTLHGRKLSFVLNWLPIDSLLFQMFIYSIIPPF